jgi:hypothetical protein
MHTQRPRQRVRSNLNRAEHSRYDASAAVRLLHRRGATLSKISRFRRGRLLRRPLMSCVGPRRPYLWQHYKVRLTALL